MRQWKSRKELSVVNNQPWTLCSDDFRFVVNTALSEIYEKLEIESKDELNGEEEKKVYEELFCKINASPTSRAVFTEFSNLTAEFLFGEVWNIFDEQEKFIILIGLMNFSYVNYVSFWNRSRELQIKKDPWNTASEYFCKEVRHIWKKSCKDLKSKGENKEELIHKNMLTKIKASTKVYAIFKRYSNLTAKAFGRGWNMLLEDKAEGKQSSEIKQLEVLLAMTNLAYARYAREV